MKNDRLKTIQDFARLRDETVASICLPTEVSGVETQKSPIRFKNLVRQLKDQLRQTPDSEALCAQIEKTCEPLTEDHDFWQHQSEGLAVLCETGACQFVGLPFSPPAATYVGKRFHVKPLLRLVNLDQQFFVLALSVNRCRLLWGDLQGLKEVQLDELPASLEDALRYDDPEKSLQFHTQAASAGGSRPAMFHGQGAGRDDPQAQIERYIDKVSGAVNDFLKTGGVSDDPKAPLVLATVEEYLPTYKRNNTYPGLMAGACVKGNPDELSAEQLHSAAWPLVQRIVKKDELDLLEQFEGLRARGKASTDPGEVSAAVRRGQVAAVFVAEDKALLGSVDPVSGEVNLLTSNEPETDVLNDIAAETLLRGGVAHVIPADRIPGDSGVAGIYRF